MWEAEISVFSVWGTHRGLQYRLKEEDGSGLAFSLAQLSAVSSMLDILQRIEITDLSNLLEILLYLYFIHSNSFAMFFPPLDIVTSFESDQPACRELWRLGSNIERVFAII
jgi:hypothetical protein